MEATKKSREELGDIFRNDACPTADSYEMIFNSMLNFSDDGVTPPELENPLIINTKKNNNSALIVRGGVEIKTKNGESILNANEKNIRFLDKGGKIGIGIDGDKNLEAILQVKSNNISDRLLQFDTKTPWYFDSNNNGDLKLSCSKSSSAFIINSNTVFNSNVNFCHGINFLRTIGGTETYSQQKKSATQFNINAPFFPQGFSIISETTGTLSNFGNFLMAFEKTNQDNINSYKTYASASYIEFLGPTKFGGSIHVPIPLEAAYLSSIQLVNFTNQGTVSSDGTLMDPCTIILFTNCGTGKSVEKEVQYCSETHLTLDFQNYDLENSAQNDFMKFLFIMVIKDINTASGKFGLSEVMITFI